MATFFNFIAVRETGNIGVLTEYNPEWDDVYSLLTGELEIEMEGEEEFTLDLECYEVTDPHNKEREVMELDEQELLHLYSHTLNFEEEFKKRYKGKYDIELFYSTCDEFYYNGEYDDEDCEEGYEEEEW